MRGLPRTGTTPRELAPDPGGKTHHLGSQWGVPAGDAGAPPQNLLPARTQQEVARKMKVWVRGMTLGKSRWEKPLGTRAAPAEQAALLARCLRTDPARPSIGEPASGCCHALESGPQVLFLRELEETGSMKTSRARSLCIPTERARHARFTMHDRHQMRLDHNSCGDTPRPERGRVKLLVRAGRLDSLPSLVAGCTPALPQTSTSASAWPESTEASHG